LKSVVSGIGPLAERDRSAGRAAAVDGNTLTGDEEMSAEKTTLLGRRWTAAELRKLPPGQRDAILEAAAALAEEDYRSHPELTAFEACGKDDLYGDSSNTETR
jgi:hypothetical protein